MFTSGEEGSHLSPRPRHPSATSVQTTSTTDPVIPHVSSGPIGTSTVTPLTSSPFTASIPASGAGTSSAVPPPFSSAAPPTSQPIPSTAAHDLGTSLSSFIDARISARLPSHSDAPPSTPQPSRSYFEEQFAVMATSFSTLADLVSRRFETVQSRMDSLDAQVGALRQQQAVLRSHLTLDRDTSESRFQYLIRTLESYFGTVGYRMEPYVPVPPSPAFTSSWDAELAALLDRSSDLHDTSARSAHRAADAERADGSARSQEPAATHSVDGASVQGQPPAQHGIITPESSAHGPGAIPILQTSDVSLGASIDLSVDTAAADAIQAEFASLIHPTTPLSHPPADDPATDA